VIIVNSKNQETDKVLGERQGAVGYVIKPVDQSEIVFVMNQVVS